MACITCALCIDACDGVMDKIGKERGLIAYATLNEYDANMALATGGGATPIDPARVRKPDGGFVEAVRHFDWKILIRPRTLLYMGVWTAVGLGLVYALLARDRLEINVLHDRNPQYVMESDGSIRNGYTVRLLNMIPEPRTIMLSLDGMPEATMKIIGFSEVPGRIFAIEVSPDQATALKVYVTLPRDAAKGEASFHFLAEDRASHESNSYSANFFVPGGNR